MAMARAVKRKRRGSLRDQAPAGRKSRAVRGTDKNIVVHIPDRCLPCASIVKHVTWLAVPVKVGCRHQLPAAGQSRPVSATHEPWPRQVPDCRLKGHWGK